MKLSEELIYRGFAAETTIKDVSELDTRESKKFYWGADPSADSLTIGNLAALMMCACFVRHGYEPYLLVGGATGQIGDPKENGERELKSLDEVEHNKKCIKGQIERVILGGANEVVDSRPSATNEERIERARPVTTGESERVENESFLSSSDKLLGYIRLEDEIRPDAKQIINYFYKNDIDVKIISGDDLEAVTKIAARVGVRDLKGINLSDLKSPDYDKLVKEYSIFTRVTPTQKKDLIKAMKKQGSTVAMTGDGVNDILAMKEADCSLAIGAGSDAARRSAKLVLLNSDFAAVPSIIDEGRQSINNLERSTALFLAKTVYASILAILFVFLPFTYPFTPIEMSLLNFACIGFPGLILALEHNTNRIKNRFTRNILTYSFPIGLTVSCCMAALSVVSHLEGFTHPELTTISVFVTFSIDLILIYWISKPLNPLRTGLLLTIISIMVAAFAVPFARDFFEFVFLSQQNLIVMLIIIFSGIAIFFVLKFLMQKLANRILGPEHI